MSMTAFDSTFGPAVGVSPAPDGAEVIVVCEHASNHVPQHLARLGVSDDVLQSHVAWDPGALAVARHIAKAFSAPLVQGEISRLVYDCNRPPEAADAIPAKSEIYDIPGNAALTAERRRQRVEGVYEPFRAALAREIANRRRALRLMVTVHSFTPVYRGQTRDVEIGLLHGKDAGFAEAMVAAQPGNVPYRTLMNEPYSAADGVAHTLDVHGAANELPSIMLEIRNDLIASAEDQAKMADLLIPWIRSALDRFEPGSNI